MNTVALYDLLLTVMDYVWTSTWVLVSLLGVMMAGGLTFAFLDVTHPNLVHEINRRKHMAFLQRNSSKSIAKSGKNISSEQKRKENLEDGWARLKLEKDLLQNYLSITNSQLNIMVRIKKKL